MKEDIKNLESMIKYSKEVLGDYKVTLEVNNIISFDVHSKYKNKKANQMGIISVINACTLGIITNDLDEDDINMIDEVTDLLKETLKCKRKNK